MSEENQNTAAEDSAEVQVDEKALLLQQARMMGLNVSNNIGVEKLREKIAAHLSEMDNKSAGTDDGEDPEVYTEELGEHATPIGTNINKLRKTLRDEAMALVRVRISNLDPKKASLHGEIFTIHNDIVGTVKMFVPFGEKTEDGWHIPKIIYEMMKSRKFQHIRSYTDPVTKQIMVERSLRSEFSLDVLPPLTAQELTDLRIAQTGK